MKLTKEEWRNIKKGLAKENVKRAKIRKKKLKQIKKEQLKQYKNLKIRAKSRRYSTLRVAKAEKKKEYQGYFQK